MRIKSRICTKKYETVDNFSQYIVKPLSHFSHFFAFVEKKLGFPHFKILVLLSFYTFFNEFPKKYFMHIMGYGKFIL